MGDVMDIKERRKIVKDMLKSSKGATSKEMYEESYGCFNMKVNGQKYNCYFFFCCALFDTDDKVLNKKEVTEEKRKEILKNPTLRNCFKDYKKTCEKVKINLKDLKQCVRDFEKERKPFPIRMKKDIVYCNPIFLFDCLKFCETKHVYVSGRFQPIRFFHNDEGKDIGNFGVLMPVRAKKECYVVEG